MSAEEGYQKEKFIKLSLNEQQRDAGPLPEIDADDMVQGLKDDVKQRSIRSVFSEKGNEKCSILGQIQTEQQKKTQSSKHQFKQQKGQFLKNKSSQFIKNTTKQVASAGK